MPDRIIEFNGVQHQFPADFTDAEIATALKGSAPASASEPDTYWGGFGKSALATAKQTGMGVLEGLNPIAAVKGMAQTVLHPIDAATGLAQTARHPMTALSSLSDPETGGKAIGNLMLGGAISRIPTGAVGTATNAVGRTMENIGTSRPAQYASGFGAYHRIMAGDVPGAAMAVGAPYALQKIGQGLQRISAPAEEAAGVQPMSAAEMAAARASIPPRAPSSAPATVDPLTGETEAAWRARVQAQIDARNAPSTSPSPGQLRPLERRGAAVRTALGDAGPSETRMAELQQKFGGTQTQPALQPIPNEAAVPMPQPPHPLQGPRLEQGAERVGRPLGLTKEDVRQATGPRIDEARGEASPVLPDQALRSIIDTMKTLPPGAEREAYVARATSGKTRWQVENIRRTLEHLGLVAPLAIAPAVMHRQAMLDQLKD